MLKEVNGNKIKLTIFSIYDFWPIALTTILLFILAYNLYKFQTNLSNYFIMFPIVILLFLVYISINFFLSKNIIIDKKAKTIRIRFWTIKFSEIKNITLGKIITFNVFSFQNIFIELKNKYIAYPGRFAPSIKIDSEEIIKILKKEIKLE